MIWVAMLAACSGEKDDSGAGGYTLTGSVSASGSAAEVYDAAAFGVNAGGSAALVVAPNPDATCADAADFLGRSIDPGWDPSAVHAAGACAITARIASYAGAEVTITDAVDATVNFGCAMDDGAWAWEERTEGDGYYYSGPFWSGSPDAFTLTVGGGDEADLAVSLTVDGGLSGSFIYEPDFEDDPGTGAVEGSTVATWCPEMGTALAR